VINENQKAIANELNEKVSRKILTSGGSLMLVEFRFKKGGVGEVHKHENHEQIGYIAQGSFELTVGDAKQIVKQGDSYYAAKNVVHGVVALEDESVIIDAFTPIREDSWASWLQCKRASSRV
jgi:quercetin dioxygenase-like cupin family protein